MNLFIRICLLNLKLGNTTRGEFESDVEGSPGWTVQVSKLRFCISSIYFTFVNRFHLKMRVFVDLDHKIRALKSFGL